MGRSVLYVVGTLELGGAEKHILSLARGLKEKGWQPEVFAFRTGGPLEKALLSHKIPVHGKLPPPKGQRSRGIFPFRTFSAVITSLWSVFRTVRSRRPDIVHFFLPEAYVLGGIGTLFMLKPRKIMSRRSLNFYQKKKFLCGALERFLHARMDRITGNSRAVVQQLQEEGVKPTKLRLIYNGISFPPSRSRPSASRSKSRAGLRMVVTANLIPYKGHADLFLALGGIRKKLPENWELLLAGRDDGLRPELEALAVRMGIAARVKFLGSVSNVNEILASSHLGILCSHEEGFSNAILEYMAAGLPVVATRVGGNSEAVVHGVTGLLVPPKNPRMLGEALLALTGPRRREKMGRAGMVRVRARFSLERCLNNYEKLYFGTFFQGKN